MTKTIISWNTNSLRKRFNDGHLKWFLDEKPDILCVQETKANEEQLNEILNGFDDYNSFYSSSTATPGYSGVAIYSKTEPVKVIDNLGFGKYKEEGRILKAEYPDFTLMNIYFPSAGDKLHEKMQFFNHFLDKTEKLMESGENVIICGDFNIAHTTKDLANPKEASRNPGFLQQERGLLDRLIAQGYYDTFRMFNQDEGNYTWWSNSYDSRAKNIGMRLDHFFISESLKDRLKSSFIRPEIMGSDHCPIGIKIDI